MTLIKNLKLDYEFAGYYLLKELETKHTTNSTLQKKYFDLVLSDSSGQISAKYWDVNPDETDMFKVMTLVKVKGVVINFRDRLQVKINNIQNVNSKDNVKITDYIRSAPIEASELINKINLHICQIKDKEIRTIVEFCVKKAKKKLEHYPAAKIHHHSYFAGLAYHIVRMLEIGDFLCNQRPFLNKDFLIAGIILHDIAKTEEYEASIGVVTDYSTKGKLIGHIVIATNWILEATILNKLEVNSEKVMLLQHLVLSHHNIAEWGSPVQPQLAEAVALHLIDSMDAKLQMAEDAINTIPLDEKWTSSIKGLDNNAMFRQKY
ncbi:phosphohydrolase [Paenibacillus swuensis]|uniref:Phosphohydrolase n=1 Tax=Paenibacillus swuensis TaxID=1178515 RepID=A0A172TE83_9BACL|nr:HD domain-containing protein [Paenibacillus swuensis]ANE45359.1 phosphohydrolase [Paenibacillus swuensis]